MAYRKVTTGRLYSRLQKEQEALAAELRIADKPARALPKKALSDLQLAVRVYQRQLDTLDRVHGYIEAGAARPVTERRHNVKRHIKRLRVSRFIAAAKRVLKAERALRVDHGLDPDAFTRTAAELAQAVDAAEALLRSTECALDRESLRHVRAVAREVAPTTTKRRWTAAENAAILAGARELPGRTPDAIITQRSRLSAPRREDDLRKTREARKAADQAEKDALIESLLAKPPESFFPAA